jgi:uncharacterized protein (TIGR02996 family)
VPRYALELVRAPPGVTVSFQGGVSRLEGAPGAHFALGRVPDVSNEVRPDTGAAWREMVKQGWGGLRSAFCSVDQAARWYVEHAGHGCAGPCVNGASIRTDRRVALSPGDELAPCLNIVFRLVEVEAPLPEPLGVLDAIAAAPDDAGRWHVLADWLLERQAPHAVMTAYELKLDEGTNDPELIGDSAAARRARQRLPGDVAFRSVTWRCGYVVSCEVQVGPRDPDEGDGSPAPSRSPSSLPCRCWRCR